MSNHKSKSLPHTKASSIDNELPEVNADAGIEGIDREFSGTDIQGSEKLVRAGKAGGDSELEDKTPQHLSESLPKSHNLSTTDMS